SVARERSRSVRVMISLLTRAMISSTTRLLVCAANGADSKRKPISAAGTLILFSSPTILCPRLEFEQYVSDSLGQAVLPAGHAHLEHATGVQPHPAPLAHDADHALGPERRLRVKLDAHLLALALDRSHQKLLTQRLQRGVVEQVLHCARQR